ncbi:MAG: OmpA family protein [Burkholderiaceae bacterium]|jgi:hypothetical protein|nr:OmpA family protein [Burkholderiaceae bacterium]
MPANHHDSNSSRIAWPGVALGAILLAVAVALGVGPVESGLREATVMTPPPDLEPGAAANLFPKSVADVFVSEAAHVETEGEAVAFYFANGSAELPEGAAEALGGIVMGVAAGKKAVIGSEQGSLANDPAGDLPRQRALAVQSALTALGIGPDKLELRPKPAAAAGSADTPQARRVEVTLE